MGFSLTASAATCLRTSVVCLFFTAALTASSSCYPRRTCGDADISRRDCESKGCCWDDAIHAEHRCFRGSRRESCEVLKLRTPCGISRLRQKNCVTGSGESSCNEPEFADSVSSSEEFGVLSHSFNWETSGDEGFDEVEMMAEVTSIEGHGYTPASNVPSKNTTSDEDALSTTVETPEPLGIDGPQPAEEAADEGTLTSQIADYSDSDGKALESRPAPDEEIEPDAEEDLELIPTTGPQGDEEPSIPPSPSEISMSESMESSEDIEDKAMESQAAPDMSEEDITTDAESEDPDQAIVTKQDLARSAHLTQTTEGQDVGTELPDHKEEKESRPSVPVESEKTDPEGILFRGSKSREESDVERERKYFETTKDLDDLEEPFISLAWAYGSIGAPESMVEFDLKFELALASAIQPETVADKTTISSSQTDSTKTQEEAVASVIPPEAFEEETTISTQTDVAEASAEAEAPAAVVEAEVIAATPMRKPEPRYETVLEERIQIVGSEGFVTYIPREVLVEEPLEETTESVGTLGRREGDQPTEVLTSEEHTEKQSTTDSVTSHNPQPTQSSTTSTQDVSESKTEDSPEFIDNPIDFRQTDSGQPSTSQEEQSSSGNLAESEGEKLKRSNRKARAKHKISDCAVSHLIPCGNGRLTKDECRDLGCCWLPLGRHLISVDCYLPQSRANLDPQISV